MSRWDNYIDNDKLNEKISKKELERSLKNDNILIGCEFEFKISDDLSFGDGEAQELYQQADREVQEYNNDVDWHDREVREYEDETSNLVSETENLKEKLDEITDAISDQESHTAELESELDDFKSELEDAESELEDAESDGDDKEIRNLKNQIIKLKKDIQIREKGISDNEDQWDDWNSEVISLERKISSNEDDIKYRQEEGIYEQIQTPYVTSNTMPAYFDYMTNWMGYSERDLEVEPGEKCDYPPEWEEDVNSNFEEAIDNSGILGDAPFSDYQVGTYGSIYQRPGSTSWAVENDESLGAKGVEIKNPPMELPDFMKNYFEDMMDWIGDVGYTDSDCGFHCHMSLKKTKGSELDYLKLILFTDEEWIYKAFEERAHNHYTKSVKDKLKTDTTITKRDLNALFNRKKLIMKIQMQSHGFDSIKVIDSATGHVEFRFMGGSNYHRKTRDISAMIAMYAHNLSLAMDPDYRRKEYAHKLQRIFNKMELYYLEKKMDMISWLFSNRGPEMNGKDEVFLKMAMKDTDQKIKQLSSIYKIDSKTRKLLDSNNGFFRGVHGESYTSLKRGLSDAMVLKLVQNYPYAIK